MRMNSLSIHFRRHFGRRVWKIPLDAGSGCPNRDGTLSRRGCCFCNPAGSGTGLAALGLDLAAQWEHHRARLAARRKATAFMAYLQSYSNTYGPTERLTQLLGELRGLPGLVAVSVGTRPDCLNKAKLDLMAAQVEFLPPEGEIWLDLGLQSACDATLARINRGHDFAAFANTVHAAHARGLKVCAHLMAGLPGEDGEAFLRSVAAVGELPVAGVKLHNLLVVRGTPLAADFARRAYTPLERQKYVELIVTALELLPAGVVIHRLQADPAPSELLAPEWAADKAGVRADILALLEARDTRQGKLATGCTSELCNDRAHSP